MSYQEQINDVKQDIQNKKFSNAQTKLENMLNSKKIKNVEDETNMYYTFNNYVELLLFYNMYKPSKKLVNIDTNISEIYYYLGVINAETKNFGKAIEYFDNGLKWNPVNVSIMFQKVATFRILKDLERYKAEIEKTYRYIYNSTYMARYFNELGWYYAEKRVFDLANALYTVSLTYVNTKIANNELQYIAQQENRNVRKSSKEEIDKLFKDYNIPFNFSNQTFQIIYNEYQTLLKEKPDAKVINFLSRVLYDITLDKKFLIYLTLQDKELGIEVKMPEMWKIMKKDAYEKFGISPNTTMLFLNTDNQEISVVCDGKCTKDQFEQAYKTNIEKMRNAGMNILKEYTIRGQKNINQVFVEANTEKGIIRILQNYVIANDYLFNISWQVTRNMELDKLLKMSNNTLAMGIVWSIKGINEDTSVQDTMVEMAKKMNELMAQGKTSHEAMEIVFGKNNNQQENESINLNKIIEEYNNNGINTNLTKLLNEFSKNIIKQDNQDPFWNTMAREMLETLVILNLVENKVDISILLEQSKDINKARQVCRTNVNKLDIAKLQNEGNFINSIKTLNGKNNDKTLLSILEIIYEALLPYDRITVHNGDFKSVNEENLKHIEKYNEYESDELKEYSQEIEGYPTFKFYFPHDLGVYSKTNANVFELKDGNTQKIRVMISKCNSEENLETDAKKWIEKNKIDAKMEEVEYRKEKINNIPLEVYILKYINNTKLANKIYKIGYVNKCRITISGGMVQNKEKIINQAFEKIEWEENKKITKIENKPIVIKCPSCNNEFELNWNVPASEKTFYCRCPNCNAEIKKGNPNYKG